MSGTRSTSGIINFIVLAAAESPSLQYVEQGAAWLDAAVVAATAEVLKEVCSPPPSLPARSAIIQSLASLDMACHSDNGDANLPPSGMVTHRMTENVGDRTTLVHYAHSSTSGESFVVIPESDVDETPMPVALHQAGAATAVDDTPTMVALHQAVAAPTVVTVTATERAGPDLGRLLRPPNLCQSTVIEVASHINVADVDTVVQHLMCRHSVPYSQDVLGHILTTAIAARHHTASRLLEQLTYLESTGASTTEIIRAMLNYLHEIYSEGSRS